MRFGIVGGGLMGKEFASAAARWLHLTESIERPEIVAVADPSPEVRAWFADRLPGVRVAETQVEILGEVDAVYAAVPHHLHESVYREAIAAGKHLFAEKPFGIDRLSAERIAAEKGSGLVRVSSEFPFFPAVQRIVRLHAEGFFGRVFEVRAAFRHSSDLDPTKPINWKRRVATCGEYGCLGDLGLHVVHVPFRLGFVPRDVRAVMSKIVAERPDGRGGMAPCETWDNATLLCRGPADETLLFETKRIAPGETNSWDLAIYGTDGSAEFTTKRPKTLRTLTTAKRQQWAEEDLGWADAAHPGITGGIFEFGFSDAVQQMWAAFLTEASGGTPPFGCATPEEALLSHRLFSAALESHATGRAVTV